MIFNEMKKITNSNLFHKSYRKYKSENGRTRTSEYIRGGIRCHGGVASPADRSHPPCAPYQTSKSIVKISVSKFSTRSNPLSKSVSNSYNGIIHNRNQAYTDHWKHQRRDQVPWRSKHPLLTDHTRREPYFQIR